MKRSLFFAVWLAPAIALACLNGVMFETEEVVQLVAKAEKLLDRGKPGRALRVLPQEDDEFEAGPALRERLRLVRAVALSRTGHALSAVPVLREQVRRRGTDPYRRARLAEALFAASQNMEEAAQILTDLETRDLMPDAEGWATLARLRAMNNDAAGRDRAITRCRAVAKRAGVCDLERKGNT